MKRPLTYDQLLRRKTYTLSTEELEIAWLRYEAIRKLNARQFKELCDRNLKGEQFDNMVDELILKSQ